MKNPSNQFKKTKNPQKNGQKTIEKALTGRGDILKFRVIREMRIKPPLATISRTPNWQKVWQGQMLERKQNKCSFRTLLVGPTMGIFIWPLWKTVYHFMTQQQLCWVYTHSRASQLVCQALESLMARSGTGYEEAGMRPYESKCPSTAEWTTKSPSGIYYTEKANQSYM